MLKHVIIAAAAGDVAVTGYESRRGLIELHTQRELSVSKPLLRVSYSHVLLCRCVVSWVCCGLL